MKIRKATKKDFLRISEIFRIEFKKKPYNERWLPKNAFKKIQEYGKKGIILVVEEEKEIFGFLIGHLDLWENSQIGFIDEIVILKKMQGKGHGKKLITRFENYLKKKNIKKLYLMSRKSSSAFQAYKKLNFIEEDFVSMVKTLK